MINESHLKESADKPLQKSHKKIQAPEKKKFAKELIITRKELIFQNEEKEKKIIELTAVIRELVFQSELKEKRAAELIVANNELVIQNEEKQKAEEERMQSEKRLARAHQVARMGNWELDFATNTVLLSDEACKIYGLAPDQNRHLFEAWLSFIHPRDLYFASKKIKESQDSLRNFSFYHRIIRSDGIVRDIYSESKLEFASNGKPKGLHGITHDVTQIKQAEIERTKVVNDLVQRNIDLEQFAYIVSHNLRAPVVNILGVARSLNYPGLSTEEKTILNQGLNESVVRLDDVIKDLTLILQVKREISEIKEKVVFSKLVDDIKISIKNLIENDNIKIKYDFSEIDEFSTIKSYLYSIFYNLISNSIKYRRPEVPGIIEIKSWQINNTIELIFTDNGMGIDLQKKGEQVFGLYKRFHTNIEGKGLGLFMVKTQVETLGGKITVQSRVDKGSEFKIVFQI